MVTKAFVWFFISSSALLFLSANGVRFSTEDPAAPRCIRELVRCGFTAVDMFLGMRDDPMVIMAALNKASAADFCEDVDMIMQCFADVKDSRACTTEAALGVGEIKYMKGMVADLLDEAVPKLQAAKNVLCKEQLQAFQQYKSCFFSDPQTMMKLDRCQWQTRASLFCQRVTARSFFRAWETYWKKSMDAELERKILVFHSSVS